MSTAEQKAAQVREFMNPNRKIQRPATVEKAYISVEVDPDLRALARAAFYVLRSRREVRSFAQFVAGALEREVKRVQDECNNGEPLVPEREALPPGRPI